MSVESELFSSAYETPGFQDFFKNECDTCGKSFVHPCSYKRHLRTQCSSKLRKRRRKLWFPDQGLEELVDEDVGVTALLDTSSEYETEGNMLRLLYL